MLLKKFTNFLFCPTPIHSLVFTRIAFGLLMIYQTCIYIFTEKLEKYFIEPEFHFKYYGFEWVKEMPGDGMYYCFLALFFLAILITIGLFYRAAIISYTILFIYIFLIDKFLYLNHYYMEILFCFLLCFMPAHRSFSLDSYYWPKIRTTLINFWPIFLIRAQFEIILLYAGIVKINYDWLHGRPLNEWLGGGSRIEILNYLFTLSWTPILASYGVIILHTIGASLLLWRRTRIYIFFIYCIFHLVNAVTFSIGVFPYMAIALTLIFFDPDWPAKILKLKIKTTEWQKHFIETSPQIKKLTVFLVTLWIIFQILFPLRYLLYPGNVLWTREGHNFSWRMKLADTSCENTFHIINPKTKETWNIFLSKNGSSCKPDLILQLAHRLQKDWKKDKWQDVEVRVTSYCSLNKRKPQLLIDPDVDLTKIKDSLLHKTWIAPFDERLDNQ